MCSLVIVVQSGEKEGTLRCSLTFVASFYLIEVGYLYPLGKCEFTSVYSALFEGKPAEHDRYTSSTATSSASALTQRSTVIPAW